MKFQYEVELSMLRKNKYYYTIYIVGLNFVFNGILPFSLIIVMNALLYKQLKLNVNIEPDIGRRVSTAPSPFRSQSFLENSSNHTNSRKGIKLNECIALHFNLQ